MKRIIILGALMLIAVLGYSQSGIDSCKTVVIKKDTFGLVPIQFITNSNRVKNMNDAQKMLLDSCQKGAFFLSKVIEIKTQQKNALQEVVNNQNKDINNLFEINNNQSKTLQKHKETINILKYVVVTETVILVLLALFK